MKFTDSPVTLGFN